MFKKILIALVLVIAGFATFVYFQPADYQVQRSLAISAPAETVFAQVNDFRRWEGWNPWGKLDPAMKLSYSGAPSGTGAVYAWAGNNQVGEGRMTLSESHPNDLIRIQMEFFKPFAGNSTAEFTFKPEGDKTLVTWSMTGKNNFIGKVMCLFMNMDKMVGGQFEKGLADLKTISETAAKPQ